MQGGKYTNNLFSQPCSTQRRSEKCLSTRHQPRPAAKPAPSRPRHTHISPRPAPPPSRHPPCLYSCTTPPTHPPQAPPVRAIKLAGQAAALDVAKGCEQAQHVLARGLKRHVAHHQLGGVGQSLVLFLWRSTGVARGAGGGRAGIGQPAWWRQAGPCPSFLNRQGIRQGSGAAERQAPCSSMC